MLSIFELALLFVRFTILCPFALVVRVTCRWWWVCNIGGIIMAGEDEVLGEKPIPVTLRPPQVSDGLPRDRTRACAVTSRRLTAWAMARPKRQSLPWTVFKYSVPTAQQTHSSATETSKLNVFFFWKAYNTHKCTVWAERIIFECWTWRYIN
jgi:hypothetical protein